MKSIEPYQQGELDGLCGIYAIINALSMICEDIDGDVADVLFRRLVAALEEHTERPMRVIWAGMGHSLLRDLLTVAEKYIAETLDVRIKRERLRALPKKASLSTFWDALQKELANQQVAILALDGKHDHWTVAYKVKRKVIRVADSSYGNVLLRSRCTLKKARKQYHIAHGSVILLSRKT